VVRLEANAGDRMGQHQNEPSDAVRARRHKPFDADRDAPAMALATAYHDPRIAALVAEGDVAAARLQLVARLRSSGEDVEPYLDMIRLEHTQGRDVWQRWAMHGLASCPDLAPRLLASVPEEALRECAVQQHVPWTALRAQRDRGAAHHLFALFVGELLWQGDLEAAFTAVVEPSFRERAEHDAEARALIVAVLAAFAWLDTTRAREVAPLLGVSLPDPDLAADELPAYPLDALEHAILLGDALRRARKRAECPPELARAIELGPFFGGRHARVLLDELSAALRARPDEALRFCDVVVETSDALAVYLAHAITELAHETPDAGAGPDERARHAIEDLARSQRRRRGAAMIAACTSVAAAAGFAWQGRLDLAFGVATPPALLGWALVGFLRDLSYVPRMRPALARALVHERCGAPGLRRALGARSELAWLARRAARDDGLALLAMLSARRAP
jgi:hypothetical protein